MRTPKRQNLSSQAYEILLEAIQSGHWNGFLPGERKLCDQFNICRSTLRIALNKLEAEKIIETKTGRRREICANSRKYRPTSNDKSVGFLGKNSKLEMPGYNYRSLELIENLIHRHGLQFLQFERPGCFLKAPDKHLTQLLEETKIDCWILQEATLETQKWFEQNRIPCILWGTPFRGVKLPFVDLDNTTVCRHAVGRLVASGKRNICYLASQPILAGDLNSAKGFEDGIKLGERVQGRILRSNGDQRDIIRKLGQIMNTASRPDGFLIDKSAHVYTLVCYLHSLGYKIPQDIAIICRTESSGFHFTIPAISHYSRNLVEVAKCISILAIKLASGVGMRVEGTILFPNYISGGST